MTDATPESPLIHAAKQERGRCWQRAEKLDTLLWRLAVGSATIADLDAAMRECRFPPAGATPSGFSTPAGNSPPPERQAPLATGAQP
ncbi:MAG: hypothetical protein ACYCZB_03090 [Acidiphilium sp.]